MKTRTSGNCPTACASERQIGKDALSARQITEKYDQIPTLAVEINTEETQIWIQVSCANTSFKMHQTTSHTTPHNISKKLKAWQSPGDNSHPSCCLLQSVSKAACKQPQILCYTVPHHFTTTNFGMQLVLNTQYLIAKYLAHFSRSDSHLTAHSKQIPLSIKHHNSTLPADGKVLSLSCEHPATPSSLLGCRWSPPKNKMSGWEQTGGGKGGGRGYHKEIKNANHVLNNDLPPKLGTGCRQGFVYFY